MKERTRSFDTHSIKAIQIEEGESVESLSSTTGNRIFGPCTLFVVTWADGGVNEYVNPYRQFDELSDGHWRIL